MTKDATVFTGPLVCSDQVMNLVLFPGKMKNKDGGYVETPQEQYCYIRGEDVSFVILSQENSINRVANFDPKDPDKDL
ncbi:Sm-like ribonucleoproteins family [Trichomonas vaginalis G3]|uniref:Sm-like ribonucleoproteins family n=1 Tax=Trichomonas vaginalis (strain ATCC PRA-98 / G3) TaxID=412133 RepID=UPI0021E5606B|nr:Sm-like ribonucleoproteins family [Trichomonas vaginalis G3]KAI5536020.1 Sm-like ribonucleoproteins family [Trichomonas vaginalis G3]